MTLSEAFPAFCGNSGRVKPAPPPMNILGVSLSSLDCFMSSEASMT